MNKGIYKLREYVSHLKKLQKDMIQKKYFPDVKSELLNFRIYILRSLGGSIDNAKYFEKLKVNWGRTPL